MAQFVNAEEVLEAYEDVRSDGSENNWACLKYEGNKLVLDGTGVEFADLKERFTEGERVYAYLRVEVGDEMSRRQKFALLSWVGPQVSTLKKAKMSTDKASVKAKWNNFAVECLFDELHDVKLENIKTQLMKAGGANYGTGR